MILQRISSIRWAVCLFALLILVSVTKAQGFPSPAIPPAFDFGDPHDQFGSKISTDGDWAVVGGMWADQTYLYERVDGIWNRRQRIGVPFAIGGTSGFAFQTEELDLRGNRLVISRAIDPDAPIAHSGSVFVFERPFAGAAFVLVATLHASDSAAGDRFGVGIAQSEDRIFVGAYGLSAVYAFGKISGNWQEVAKIVQPDPTGADRFGNWISIDGADLLISAHRHRPTPTTRGAVYVYRFGASWLLAQKIVQPAIGNNLNFGQVTHAEMGRMAVTATTSVQMFSRNGGGVWEFSSAIIDPLGGLGYANQRMVDVHFQGSTLALTAIGADANFNDDAYTTVTYRESSGIWTRIDRVRRQDQTIFYPGQLAVGLDYLLVGAPGLIAPPRSLEQGAVVSYLHSDGDLGPSTIIRHGVGNIPDTSGSSIDADAGWAIARANGSDRPALGQDSGSVLLFREQAGAWLFERHIDSDPESGGPAGVAIAADRIYIGYPDATSSGIPAPYVQVLAQDLSGTWSDLCQLVPGDALQSFGRFVTASTTSVLVLGQEQTTFRGKIFGYERPITACNAGVQLPSTDPLANYTEIDIAANYGVAKYFTQGSNGLQVFRRDGSSWLLHQLTAIDEFAESPVITDTHLAYLGGPGIALLTLSGGQFVADLEISGRFLGPLAIGPDRIIANNRAFSRNGSASVYSINSGLQTGVFLPTGLTDEDGLPSDFSVLSDGSALLGWSSQDRGGYNNSGAIYSLSSGAGPTIEALTGQVLVPLDSAPLPDTINSSAFESF